MSPKSVPLQVGLVKCDHLHHRYQELLNAHSHSGLFAHPCTQLAINVTLLATNQTLRKPPFIIVHEPGSFPVDNYGHYLYLEMKPAKHRYVFYLKTNVELLGTRLNPCSRVPIQLLGFNYTYNLVSRSSSLPFLSFHCRSSLLPWQPWYLFFLLGVVVISEAVQFPFIYHRIAQLCLQLLEALRA
ncbi:unnamed protein product [Protopolystoma xenopodis]|uniref:Uncharacterized protein n=1 Tax=Protopolystoma xenopodis TaxID=117903 RepID=A0A448WUM3_9PLAT|nr:unnamed protein product [Protopolystoma xenopodis]